MGEARLPGAGFGRLRHSCIETDQAGIPQYSDCDTGNIDDDPEFVDPDATDPRDRDYRLQSTSPCRDTGDTVEILLERWRDVYDLDQNGFVEAPTPDLDLTARRKNCHVDMGAYEHDLEAACPYESRTMTRAGWIQRPAAGPASWGLRARVAACRARVD
ncbi:MAG: hypothetical protein KF817_04745 [Phycisphaeraceae bacterium]|nr:hypothetical protein [Phycisphaeraceae bacterium]